MRTPGIPACPLPRAQGPHGDGHHFGMTAQWRLLCGNSSQNQILGPMDGCTKLREGEELT